MYRTEPFIAHLGKSLDAAEVYLPVSHAPYADLLRLLADPNDYTILTITDDTNEEVVKAKASGGTIILERGLGGTVPVKLSYGARVATVPPALNVVIEERIRELLGCYFDDTVLDVADVRLPVGTATQEYYGYLRLSGQLPMKVEISGTPVWACVTQTANIITITGRPPDPGTFVIHLTATNLNGANKVERNLEINVVSLVN